jgi:hypothetical protein
MTLWRLRVLLCVGGENYSDGCDVEIGEFDRVSKRVAIEIYGEPICVRDPGGTGDTGIPTDTDSNPNGLIIVMFMEV